MQKSFFRFSILVLLATACRGPENPLREERYSGYAQGTSFHITLLHGSENLPNMEATLDSIFRAMDASMSTYDSSSLISLVNRGDTIVPDAFFTAMLRRSGLVYRHSEGYFDPTVGPLVRLWGFGPEARRQVDSAAVKELLPHCNFGLLDSSQFSGLLGLPPKMELDFNAIAQGYTVDVICEFFNGLGIKNYMVEVGGELRCRGKNLAGEVWRIGVDKPVEKIEVQDRFQFIVALDSLALATSGNYRKYWVDSATGIRYAHTISPHSGFPVQSRLLSASVVTHQTADADAYATAFMAMGLEKSLRFLREERGHVPLEAYLIYSDEAGHWEVFKTAGLEKMILNPE